MRNLTELGPLFQWAHSQATRRPLPANVRRIATRARVSQLHALAFCEANGIIVLVTP